VLEKGGLGPLFLKKIRVYIMMKSIGTGQKALKSKLAAAQPRAKPGRFSPKLPIRPAPEQPKLRRPAPEQPKLRRPAPEQPKLRRPAPEQPKLRRPAPEQPKLRRPPRDSYDQDGNVPYRPTQTLGKGGSVRRLKPTPTTRGPSARPVKQKKATASKGMGAARRPRMK
jgi:hypothetical protein